VNPAYYLSAGAIPGFLLSTRTCWAVITGKAFGKKIPRERSEQGRLFFQNKRSKAEPP